MEKRVVVMPIYNEKILLVRNLIKEIKSIGGITIIIVDDGNPVEISEKLVRLADVYIQHFRNQGYGISIKDGLKEFWQDGFDKVVTIDADGQHFPKRLPIFFDLLNYYDIVAGSRYLPKSLVMTRNQERQRVNEIIKEEIEQKTGVRISDPFCGYVGYTRKAISKLNIATMSNCEHYKGYHFPIEIWCRIIKRELKFTEIPVELYYPKKNKKFPEPIQNPERRIKYYKEIIGHYFP